MTTGTEADAQLPEFLSDETGFDSQPAMARVHARADSNIPGEAGVWIFILGDMTIFGAIMLVLLSEHRRRPQFIADSATELNANLGAVNTMVLLISSYCVVRATYAHRGNRHPEVTRWLIGALGCAALFAVLKMTEYVHEFTLGNTPPSNIFFTYYFALTGLHLVHVVVGVVLLRTWSAKARRGQEWSSARISVECIAVYWHMVDLLWIAIFTLVYLVCAQ